MCLSTSFPPYLAPYLPASLSSSPHLLFYLAIPLFLSLSPLIYLALSLHQPIYLLTPIHLLTPICLTTSLLSSFLLHPSLLSTLAKHQNGRFHPLAANRPTALPLPTPPSLYQLSSSVPRSTHNIIHDRSPSQNQKNTDRQIGNQGRESQKWWFKYLCMYLRSGYIGHGRPTETETQTQTRIREMR